MRKYDNRREETKVIKNALKRAGINAVVEHGKGTAWGWIDINIGKGASQELREKTENIVKEVTGRSGEYGGKIIILTQDKWDRKLNKSVPILQS